MSFKIIYQDQNIISIEKPSGYHVHPPENRFERIERDKIVLYKLKEQINCYLYPVHRLDVATSGILVFALNKEWAQKLCQKFQEQNIYKEYHAVVRGWLPDQITIEKQLELDSTQKLVDAKTECHTLARIELPHAVGKRFNQARYSLIKAIPHSGRYHQIRRHMNRISHPIVGDTSHGDSHHNRFFKQTLEIQGLCLRSTKLSFNVDETQFCFETQDDSKWQKIFKLFNFEKIS